MVLKIKGGSADALVAAIHQTRRIALKAGSRPHRLIPLWAVVVEGRVFVRSWGLKPRSWYRVLLEQPTGVLQVGKTRRPFRAVHTRSAHLKAAVDRAYREKYAGPTEIRFARDLSGAKSRATTMELVLE